MGILVVEDRLLSSTTILADGVQYPGLPEARTGSHWRRLFDGTGVLGPKTGRRPKERVVSLSPTIQFDLASGKSQAAMNEAALYVHREMDIAFRSGSPCLAVMTVPSYAAQVTTIQALIDSVPSRTLPLLPCSAEPTLVPLFYDYLQDHAAPPRSSPEPIILYRMGQVPASDWQALEVRLPVFGSLPLYVICVGLPGETAQFERAAPQWACRAIAVDLHGKPSPDVCGQAIEKLEHVTDQAVAKLNAGILPTGENMAFVLQSKADDAQAIIDEISNSEWNSKIEYLRRLRFLRGNLYTMLHQPLMAFLEYEWSEYWAHGSEPLSTVLRCRLEMARSLVATLEFEPARTERLDRAAFLLEEYLEANPCDPFALYTRGLVHYSKGHPRQALEDWDAAAPHLTDCFDLNWRAGEAALSLKDLPRAITYLDHAHKLFPLHTRCTEALREAYRLGGFEENLKQLEINSNLLALIEGVDFSGLDATKNKFDEPIC